MSHTIPLLLSTAVIIPHKQHDSLKLPNLLPVLYIIMQISAILGTCRIVRKFLAEQWIRSAWSVRPVHFWEPSKLLRSQESGWWRWGGGGGGRGWWWWSVTQFTDWSLWLSVPHLSHLCWHSTITNLNIFLSHSYSFLLVDGWWLS